MTDIRNYLSATVIASNTYTEVTILNLAITVAASYISHPYVPFLFRIAILIGEFHTIHESYSWIAGKLFACILCLHLSSSFFGKTKNRHAKPGFPFQKPMELSCILFAIPLIQCCHRIKLWNVLCDRTRRVLQSVNETRKDLCIRNK